MPKYLDPKADLTFKNIFGNEQHKKQTISLLNALLPLESDVVEINFLTPELVPDNPFKKDTVVDVSCVDQMGRRFIVEMQMYWTSAFIHRVVFNAAKTYVRQADKGFDYNALQPVFALNLINAIAFKDSEDFYHKYRLTDEENSKYTIDDLRIVFVELPKFKSENKLHKKMMQLWLKFLTEINEKTEQVSSELTEVEEIKEALQMLEVSAYNDNQLSAYDKFWDIVSREKTALSESERKGFLKGIETGLAEGEKIGMKKGKEVGIEIGERNKAIQMAKILKKQNIPLETIILASGLSAEEILNL